MPPGGGAPASSWSPRGRNRAARPPAPLDGDVAPQRQPNLAASHLAASHLAASHLAAASLPATATRAPETRSVSHLGDLIFALLASAALGALLGWASDHAYVIGLAPLLIGVGAGAAACVAALGLRGTLTRGTVASGTLAALVGLAVVVGLEDRQFCAAYRRDLAQARYVAAGVPENQAFSDEDLPFYEAGADTTLEAYVVQTTGVGGPVGRWLLRADSGVRLVGPWEASRGLPVGRWGAALWALAEVLIACLMVRLVVRRVEVARRGSSGPSAAA